VTWLRKYGNFDWEIQSPSNMPKNTRTKFNGTWIKSQTPRESKKVFRTTSRKCQQECNYFYMIIDLAEKEYNISIRPNS